MDATETAADQNKSRQQPKRSVHNGKNELSKRQKYDEDHDSQQSSMDAGNTTPEDGDPEIDKAAGGSGNNQETFDWSQFENDTDEEFQEALTNSLVDATKPTEQIAAESKQANAKRAKIQLVLDVFPAADNEFIRSKLFVERINVEQLIQRMLADSSYPRRVDREKKERNEQKRLRILAEFDVNEFLRRFEDPETYFSDQTRVVSDNYAKHALVVLSNMDLGCSKQFLEGILKHHNNHLTPTIDYLDQNRSRKGRYQYTKDLPSQLIKLSKAANVNRGLKWPEEIDEQFFWEYHYINNREYILETIGQHRIVREQTVAEARDNNLLTECAICTRDDVLPEEMMNCGKLDADGLPIHRFCDQCLAGTTNATVSEGGHNIGCLYPDCEEQISHNRLQNVIKPEVLDRLLRAAQRDELRMADIENIESCPFCDFSVINENKENRVFDCLNPDCLKKSCRDCRKASHIPLKCAEVEDDVQVHYRTYVENKMAEAMIRKCPRCGVPIVKLSGCNMMRCQSCHTQICYVCKQQIHGYDHFSSRDPRSGCHVHTDTDSVHADVSVKAGLEAEKAYAIEYPERAAELQALRAAAGPCGAAGNQNATGDARKQIVNVEQLVDRERAGRYQIGGFADRRGGGGIGHHGFRGFDMGFGGGMAVGGMGFADRRFGFGDEPLNDEPGAEHFQEDALRRAVAQAGFGAGGLFHHDDDIEIIEEPRARRERQENMLRRQRARAAAMEQNPLTSIDRLFRHVNQTLPNVTRAQVLAYLNEHRMQLHNQDYPQLAATVLNHFLNDLTGQQARINPTVRRWDQMPNRVTWTINQQGEEYPVLHPVLPDNPQPPDQGEVALQSTDDSEPEPNVDNEALIDQHRRAGPDRQLWQIQHDQRKRNKAIGQMTRHGLGCRGRGMSTRRTLDPPLPVGVPAEGAAGALTNQMEWATRYKGIKSPLGGIGRGKKMENQLNKSKLNEALNKLEQEREDINPDMEMQNRNERTEHFMENQIKLIDTLIQEIRQHPDRIDGFPVLVYSAKLQQLRERLNRLRTDHKQALQSVVKWGCSRDMAATLRQRQSEALEKLNSEVLETLAELLKVSRLLTERSVPKSVAFRLDRDSDPGPCWERQLLSDAAYTESVQRALEHELQANHNQPHPAHEQAQLHHQQAADIKRAEIESHFDALTRKYNEDFKRANSEYRRTQSPKIQQELQAIREKMRENMHNVALWRQATRLENPMDVSEDANASQSGIRDQTVITNRDAETDGMPRSFIDRLLRHVNATLPDITRRDILEYLYDARAELKGQPSDQLFGYVLNHFRFNCKPGHKKGQATSKAPEANGAGTDRILERVQQTLPDVTRAQLLAYLNEAREALKGLKLKELCSKVVQHFLENRSFDTDMNEAVVCDICFEPASEGEVMHKCPSGCPLNYHKHCISRWLITSGSCPCCKRNWPIQEFIRNTASPPESTAGKTESVGEMESASELELKLRLKTKATDRKKTNSQDNIRSIQKQLERQKRKTLETAKELQKAQAKELTLGPVKSKAMAAARARHEQLVARSLNELQATEARLEREAQECTANIRRLEILAEQDRAQVKLLEHVMAQQTKEQTTPKQKANDTATTCSSATSEQAASTSTSRNKTPSEIDRYMEMIKNTPELKEKMRQLLIDTDKSPKKKAPKHEDYVFVDLAGSANEEEKEEGTPGDGTEQMDVETQLPVPAVTADSDEPAADGDTIVNAPAPATDLVTTMRYTLLPANPVAGRDAAVAEATRFYTADNSTLREPTSETLDRVLKLIDPF